MESHAAQRMPDAELDTSHPKSRLSTSPQMSSFDYASAARIPINHPYQAPPNMPGSQFEQVSNAGMPANLAVSTPGFASFTRRTASRPRSRPSSASVRKVLTQPPSAATIQHGGVLQNGAFSLQGSRVPSSSSAFSQSELRRAAARRVDLRTRGVASQK